MTRRVLVTGAGGFLGRHLVQQLRQQGYAVRALLRRPLTGAVGEPAFPAEVECVVGDVCRPETVAHLAEGCWGIVHAAALAQVNPARDPAVWDVNYGGTDTVLRLARQAAVQRFVYVGTANVFGFGPLARPGDETHPFAGRRYGLDYMDSKRAATALVEQAVREWRLPAVLVHPTFMLGPGDAKPTSNALLLELLRGRVPGYPAGGKNYVHVHDVAVAAVNALTQGRVGESYVLGHQNLSYRDAFRLMAEVLHVPAPRWPIPTPLARLYGTASALGARLTGRPGRLNPAMVAVAADGHYFDAAKARAELGLPQTPIAQAVADAYDWFKTHRYV
ncbi:NAD-dependent epimerase/dehydratase family protein [Hymenobacter fodinae]|uniref:NAD-dependent epimerase/dehydratase family protein n=1 Tax=Hymenobacter fodinae TaxID=2510796 RepID=A0A4Z0NYM1_9BACT|nr:NAD-dependent epimerase/dehydratase family protein [Hymenobacter fodinae]TGE03740.1 NAD-dependent epimerase/dehydratase family protein [Hymenobacter fodinae]